MAYVPAFICWGIGFGLYLKGHPGGFGWLGLSVIIFLIAYLSRSR